MFLASDFISDLYLLQNFILLNPCLNPFKSLKYVPVISLWGSINTQSFAHCKPNFSLQFIKGKLRELQKLLWYLTGIITSTFNDGTGGCSGWSAFPSFPGLGYLSGASPTIFGL